MEDSCQAFLKSLVTIAKTLEAVRKNDATAKGLLKQMRSAKFLIILSAFCDALPALNSLSKTFQCEDVDISMIHARVKQTKESVEHQIDNPGKRVLIPGVGSFIVASITYGQVRTCLESKRP